MIRRSPLKKTERRTCRVCLRKVERTSRGGTWVHVRALAVYHEPEPYKTKRTPKRTSLRVQCDGLASRICKALAGWVCRRCGYFGSGPDRNDEYTIGLEWSHRPSTKRSSSMATRWDEDAADCLCHACHTYLEKRPAEYNAWLVSRGVDVLALEARANTLWNKEYPVERLRARLAEVLAERKAA